MIFKQLVCFEGTKYNMGLETNLTQIRLTVPCLCVLRYVDIKCPEVGMLLFCPTPNDEIENVC